MKNNSKQNGNCSHEEAVKWLQGIAYRKINGNTNLIELLAYEGTSLWWYLDLPLYYSLKNFLRQDKLESTFSEQQSAFYSRLEASRLLLINFIGIFYLFTKTFVRFIYGILTNLITKNDHKKYTILIPSYSSSWRESNILGKSKKKDEMVGDIIKELLSRDFRVVACDICGDFPRLGIKQLVEKNISEGKLWRPLDTYLTITVLQKTFFSWMYYRKNWNNIKRNPEFYKLFLYKDVDTYPIFKNVFEKFFGYNLLNALLQIELIKHAIDNENADLILTNCDHCTFGRSTVIAGKERGVPTLSSQMASITPYSREYMYTKNEINTIPMPDTIAVTGQYYQNLLTKKSFYHAKKVVVTGQPRYDPLNKLEGYSKKEFCDKNNISYYKKIILVTTFPVGLEQLSYNRAIFVSTLLKNITNLSSVEIIIKPHPREDGNYYSRFLRRGVSFRLLSKRDDTYEALYACDVLITFSSTTGLEAMIMDKPVVVINLTGEPEGIPYVKSGAAIGVHKEEDLVPAIKGTLYNKEVRKKLAEARKKFVYEHAYIQDGQASKRVADLIMQIIEGTRRSRS